MELFFPIIIIIIIGFIVNHFDNPQTNKEINTPQTMIINDDLAVGDIVKFEVFNIKKSEFNQERQSIRGQVLSFGKERIEIDNFDRRNDPKAKKDNQGRARRQYRFDQILGGRNNIRIVYNV